MHRCRPALTAIVLAVPLLLTACGSKAPGPSTAATGSVRVVRASEAAALISRAGTVVLDVRTPAEYAAQHVVGARNIDINSSGFRGEITALARAASYVVYCHSGNRSAAAVAIMRDEGFTQVADAGGLAGLVAAGAKVATA